MTEQQESAAARTAYSLALHRFHLPRITAIGAPSSTSGGIQSPQPAQPHGRLPTSTTPQSPPPHISHMPDEILLNIERFLHPTTAACLSVTCSKMHKFFGRPAASTPGLTTTVQVLDAERLLVQASLTDKYLWELLEGFMEPRIWAGYYGVEKFVNLRIYQEARNRYWTLNPQRPYCIKDPSPWIRPGGEAVDVEGEIEKMKDVCVGEQDMQEKDTEEDRVLGD